MPSALHFSVTCLGATPFTVSALNTLKCTLCAGIWLPMLHPDLSEVAYIMEGTHAVLLVRTVAASLCFACFEDLLIVPQICLIVSESCRF